MNAEISKDFAIRPERVKATRQYFASGLVRKMASVEANVRLVYLPPLHNFESFSTNLSDQMGLTALNDYKQHLINQGVSAELTQDIIDGLADSSLYDGKTP